MSDEMEQARFPRGPNPRSEPNNVAFSRWFNSYRSWLLAVPGPSRETYATFINNLDGQPLNFAERPGAARLLGYLGEAAEFPGDEPFLGALFSDGLVQRAGCE